MSERLAKRDRRALAGLCVIVVVALYLPFVGVPWEYDDKVEILQNRVLRHPGNTAEMIRYNPFRVLLLYTFAWDVWAWGLDHPHGARAMNIATHALNTLLILSLLDRLGGRVGTRDAAGHRLFVGAGALVFAVHPLAIESVTYVSGRSSSLATLFVLGSLWAYVRYLELLDVPGVAEHHRAAFARANLALGVLLGAGLVAGIPLALAVSAGSLEGARALQLGAGISGVIVVVAAATLGGRWRAIGQDTEPGGRAVARRAGRFYTAAWVAFVLGCLTKEIAATLPAVLFLAEGTLWSRSWRAAIRTLRGRLFPFFAIPGFLITLRVAAYGYVASPVPIRPWGTNLTTQVEVVWRYVLLWVVPYPQSVYHDRPAIPAPGTALTWVLAAALVAVAVWAIRRRATAPALAFGLLCAGVTLAPTSSVFALKETMVEHRTYLPTVGWVFAVAWVFGTLLPRWLGARGAAALLVGTCVGYGALHVSYDMLWRNEEVLWSHAVQTNPGASDAWRNLGDLYAYDGRLTEAADAYRSAIEARPSNIEARSNLGRVLGMSGRLDEAERALIDAVDRFPCHTPALNNLAAVRVHRSDHSGAVDLYDASLRCEPDNPMAHRGLGNLYYGPLRDRHKAAEHYSRFLELADPHHRDVPLIKQRVLESTF